MWIPQSVDEIERVVAAGQLQETATFDAKKELPTKSKELARDVAAMANEGGVLLYGVGEDQNGQPTILAAFPLQDVRERITSIVRTCIAEPPDIDVREYRTTSDPTKGYIAIVVPRSSRAPHMVIVEKDNRYYGRTATGNSPLTEGQVALLYQRRQFWDRNIDEMLNKEMEYSPLLPDKDFAFFYLFAWPVATDNYVLERARQNKKAQSEHAILSQLLQDVTKKRFARENYSPAFQDRGNWRRQAEGWKTYLAHSPEYNSERKPSQVLDIQVNHDGSGWMFCGRAAQRDNSMLYFIEDLVAGLSTKFIYMLGTLYDWSGFLGQVDVATVVTNLQGATTVQTRNVLILYEKPPSYDRPEYRQKARVLAATMLQEPQSVAQELVGPLIAAITQGRYDPFAEMKC